MKNTYIFITILIVLFFSGYAFYKANTGNSATRQTQKTPHVITVVAAENFYGDIVRQLGGNHVQVTSILSDPNVDPHEYEANVQDGVAISKANLIIKNGDNYDTWMDKLLSASPNKDRVILTGADIADHKLADNPHVWYRIDNIETIAVKITNALKQKDPADAGEFDQNVSAFDNSLQPLRQKMSAIKATYNTIPVALTETIYLYQTQPMGLHVLTPLTFERAIAEGNDPSADDVAKATDQIAKKQVKILIYNEQTVTPVTTNLQQEAKKQHIPLVSVWETLPKGKHYQSWMMDQLTNLENALRSA